MRKRGVVLVLPEKKELVDCDDGRVSIVVAGDLSREEDDGIQRRCGCGGRRLFGRRVFRRRQKVWWRSHGVSRRLCV